MYTIYIYAMYATYNMYYIYIVMYKHFASVLNWNPSFLTIIF